MRNLCVSVLILARLPWEIFVWQHRPLYYPQKINHATLFYIIILKSGSLRGYKRGCYVLLEKFQWLRPNFPQNLRPSQLNSNLPIASWFHESKVGKAFWCPSGTLSLTQKVFPSLSVQPFSAHSGMFLKEHKFYRKLYGVSNFSFMKWEVSSTGV